MDRESHQIFFKIINPQNDPINYAIFPLNTVFVDFVPSLPVCKFELASYSVVVSLLILVSILDLLR